MSLRIAIDGPVGSGKGTVSKLLARRLGIKHVETGALYRAIAYYLMERNVDHEDESKVSEVLKEISIDQKYIHGIARTYLNGRDVTEHIYSEEVGRIASIISAYPSVRSFLLELQRELVKDGGIIEGRDIGTVVLPDADVKIFLTATLEERVKRKMKQWKVSYDEAYRLVLERDLRDTNRKVAPLRKAEDAIEIDTTGKTPEQVVEEILRIVELHEYKVEDS